MSSDGGAPSSTTADDGSFDVYATCIFAQPHAACSCGCLAAGEAAHASSCRPPAAQQRCALRPRAGTASSLLSACPSDAAAATAGLSPVALLDLTELCAEAGPHDDPTSTAAPAQPPPPASSLPLSPLLPQDAAGSAFAAQAAAAEEELAPVPRCRRVAAKRGALRVFLLEARRRRRREQGGGGGGGWLSRDTEVVVLQYLRERLSLRETALPSLLVRSGLGMLPLLPTVAGAAGVSEDVLMGRDVFADEAHACALLAALLSGVRGGRHADTTQLLLVDLTTAKPAAAAVGRPRPAKQGVVARARAALDWTTAAAAALRLSGAVRTGTAEELCLLPAETLRGVRAVAVLGGGGAGGGGFGREVRASVDRLLAGRLPRGCQVVRFASVRGGSGAAQRCRFGHAPHALREPQEECVRYLRVCPSHASVEQWRCLGPHCVASGGGSAVSRESDYGWGGCLGERVVSARDVAGHVAFRVSGGALPPGLFLGVASLGSMHNQLGEHFFNAEVRPQDVGVVFAKRQQGDGAVFSSHCNRRMRPQRPPPLPHLPRRGRRRRHPSTVIPLNFLPPPSPLPVVL